MLHPYRRTWATKRKRHALATILLNGAMMDRAAREREVLLEVLRQIVEADGINTSSLEA
jgi:hypothetical protein